MKITEFKEKYHVSLLEEVLVEQTVVCYDNELSLVKDESLKPQTLSIMDVGVYDNETHEEVFLVSVSTEQQAMKKIKEEFNLEI